MSTHTTIRSYTAIAVGLFFTGVTLFVLLDDVVRHGAALTIKHIVTVAVLLGTVYFGHRFWHELRLFHIGTTLGCAVLFLAGTLCCVLMSAGRNAEVITNKVVHANNSNADRIQTLLDREEAKARYKAALAAEASECGTGKGARCVARRETTASTRADLDKYEAAVRSLPGEMVANADIAASAALLAKLPGVTADKASIEAALELGYPFVQSLFCELAAICGFGIAFGHGRRKIVPVSGPVSEEAQVSIVSVPSTVSPATVSAKSTQLVRFPERFPQPARGVKPTKLKRVWPTDIQHVVEALEKLGGVAESNDQLAAIMGITKGESSKRLYTCVEAGAVSATRRGRKLEIRPA